MKVVVLNLGDGPRHYFQKKLAARAGSRVSRTGLGHGVHVWSGAEEVNHSDSTDNDGKIATYSPKHHTASLTPGALENIRLGSRDGSTR